MLAIPTLFSEAQENHPDCRAIAVYMAIEALKINLLWVSSEARSVSSSARFSAAGHGRSGSSLNS